MTIRKWGAYIVGTMFVAQLLLAVPAQANVATYLEALRSAGIHRGDSEALEMGSEVCALRALGVRPERVQDQAVNNSRSYPANGLTLEEAAQIVAIATVELCDKRLTPKPVAPTGFQQGRTGGGEQSSLSI
jgi:hypothetical protein